MKILVTGANGFVGQRVVERLRVRFSVNCLQRRPPSPGVAGCFIFESFQDRSFAEALDQVDVIVHLAAQLHGPWDEMYQANVEFTRQLVAQGKTRARHFIYVSTENVTQGNQDIYTRTKQLGEDEVKKFPSFLILRPTIIYGPGDRKYVGRLAGIIRRSPIIPILGDGRNLFQFIHTDDVVAMIEQAIQGAIGGTHTIAGPDAVTYNRLVHMMMGQMRIKKPVIHVPARLLRPLSRILNFALSNPPLTPSQVANLSKDRNYDISKVVRTFGYTPTPLTTGLADVFPSSR